MQLRSYLRIGGIGIATGWVSGISAFVLIHPETMAYSEYAFYPLAFIVIAGAFAYLFADSLTESIYSILLCFLFGSTVFLTSQLAPLYILPYDPETRRVLMIPFLARAVTTAITKYIYYLLSGYMAAVGGSYLYAHWQGP
ncbi:MAG: hypothetical protein ABEH65_10740 [Halobacteriales archaeon]